MKWSTTTSRVACGAAALAGSCAGQLPKPLPLNRFSGFETISADDAWAGLTKAHHLNTTLGTIDIPAIALPGVANTPDVGTINEAAVPTAVTCDNPNLRFEWRSYSDTDRHAFVDAIACLIQKPASGNFVPAANRYEDLVRVHQMNVNTVHGNNIFLPWHRYYVWTFEQIMRDECGFDRAFPWWDEELDAGQFAASSIFTDSFFGSLPAATDGAGTCITDGVSCLAYCV